MKKTKDALADRMKGMENTSIIQHLPKRLPDLLLTSDYSYRRVKVNIEKRTGVMSLFLCRDICLFFLFL